MINSFQFNCDVSVSVYSLRWRFHLLIIFVHIRVIAHIWFVDYFEGPYQILLITASAFVNFPLWSFISTKFNFPDSDFMYLNFVKIFFRWF